jgi:hypothetical protein
MFFLINDLGVANLFLDLFFMFIINQISTTWEKSSEKNDHRDFKKSLSLNLNCEQTRKFFK